MKTPLRHGLALILLITLCASLFLVYNAGFHGSAGTASTRAGGSRDGSDAVGRSQETPSAPGKKPAPPHPDVLQGYNSIIDHKVGPWHSGAFETLVH
ncbi:hypothetical protein UPYG_G00303060 [Umbra pygmaea]|uniref:Uncharacterized protein n=1 Tax=Umbra pygmaea TaxID=75934 RepID=A0ABD0WTH9_UMBPY